MAGLADRARQYLANIVLATLVYFLELFIPNDPAGMYWILRPRLDAKYAPHLAEEELLQRQRRMQDTPMCRAAVSVLCKAPRRSLQARTTMALVAAEGYAFAAAVIAACHAVTTAAQPATDARTPPSARTRNDSDAQYVEDDDVGGARGAIAGAGSGSSNDHHDDSEDVSGDEAPSHASYGSSLAASEAFTTWAYRSARADYRRLQVFGTLDMPAITRSRRSDAAVASVLDFMFRADNTTTLSWGATVLQVGDSKEVIQARNRLQSLSALWKLYDKEMKQGGVHARDRVQRTVFFRLAGAVTARDLKVWTSR